MHLRDIFVLYFIKMKTWISIQSELICVPSVAGFNSSGPENGVFFRPVSLVALCILWNFSLRIFYGETTKLGFLIS